MILWWAAAVLLLAAPGACRSPSFGVGALQEQANATHISNPYNGTLQVLAVDDWRNATAPRGDTWYALRLASGSHLTLDVAGVTLPEGLFSGAAVAVQGYMLGGKLVVTKFTLLEPPLPEPNGSASP